MERPTPTRRHRQGRDTISEPSTQIKPSKGLEMAQDRPEATPVYLTQQHLYVQVPASPNPVFPNPAPPAPFIPREGKKSPEETRGDACDVRSPATTTALAPTSPRGQKRKRTREGKKKETYKRQPTIPTRRNLRLVRVDENLGVSCCPTASIARHDPVVRPLHRLLVDELDGRVRPGLEIITRHHHRSA